MKGRLLVGITGSFCNHKIVFNELEKLTDNYELTFVLTKNVSKYDTRFALSSEIKQKCRQLSNHEIIMNIVEAEKIGPLNSYDMMIVVPCSANSLSRIVHGAYDCPVSLCVKAMVRNKKNVIIGLSSNDVLGISGVNFMKCLNMKHFYTLPIYQDDPINKPNSCTSCYELMEETLSLARKNIQIQPILREKKV